MKYAEIVAAIEGSELDNKADIIKALNAHVKGISTEAEVEKTKLQEQLDAVLEAAGTGEGNLSERVKALVSSVQDLTQKLEASETKLTEKENQYQQLERQTLIKDAARTVGLENEAALSELLKPEDELSFENGEVRVNNKLYKDWVEQDKSAFAKSLLPVDTQVKLPFGGANPKTRKPSQESAAKEYMAVSTWRVSK